MIGTGDSARSGEEAVSNWATDHACVPDEDELHRLSVFRASNPEWCIGFDHSVEVWRAFRDLPHGFELHCRHELKKLLDDLEAIIR
jgi:hypothetical protein